MQIYVLALNRTDSVTEGFLPAAERLGAEVVVLTDSPDQYPAASVVGCDVRDVGEVIGCVTRLGRPDAIFSNSDHLQVQAALAAGYFGLPAKDWTAALRTKNKALMRRHLSRAGADTVASAELSAGRPLDDVGALPYPCVVKPREGVASEDVFLCHSPGELALRVAKIRERRPGGALVVEEFLDGPLCTLETLGTPSGLHVLGSFRTRLSRPPHFVEEGLDWCPDLPPTLRDDVLRQLRVLGVGLGACHTEFVAQGDRARLVEVNYRIVGDQCDLFLADVLDLPLFELVLRAHLGEDVVPSTAPAAARQGRVDYVCATAEGTLRAAPEPQDRHDDKVLLRYRPLRPVGSPIRLTRSNRDYLGVLRAIGDDRPAVDRAVEDFLAANTWEIRP